MHKLTKAQQQQADKYRKAGITVTDDLDVKGKPGFEGKMGVAFCEGKWQLCIVKNFNMWNGGKLPPKYETSWAIMKDPTLMILIDKVLKLEEVVDELTCNN
jgi:hypothetical protein